MIATGLVSTLEQITKLADGYGDSSHLCGRPTCNRPSHRCWESSDVNLTRIQHYQTRDLRRCAHYPKCILTPSDPTVTIRFLGAHTIDPNHVPDLTLGTPAWIELIIVRSNNSLSDLLPSSDPSILQHGPVSMKRSQRRGQYSPSSSPVHNVHVPYPPKRFILD